MVSKGLTFSRWLGFHHVTSKDWRSDSWGIHFCLFHPTDTQNLPKGKTKKSGASVISKPPPRVKESPWTLEALTPALTRSTRKHPGPQQFSAVPEEKASKPLKPVKDDVTQPVPTQEDFELAQEPTREATHKTALPDLKANEPTISSAEVPHPETQPDYTPIVESSQ